MVVVIGRDVVFSVVVVGRKEAVRLRLRF